MFAASKVLFVSISSYTIIDHCWYSGWVVMHKRTESKTPEKLRKQTLLFILCMVGQLKYKKMAYYASNLINI